jgi:hypothetical protein
MSPSLDGLNDARNAMALMANAYGVQRDLLVFDDILTDVDWDGLESKNHKNGFWLIAETATIWQTLRYPKERFITTMGIQCISYKKNEQ